MQKKYCCKYLLLITILFIVGQLNAQWNPNHAIGSYTNTYTYNYTQVPDKLTEYSPPIAGGGSGFTYQWEQSLKPLTDFVAIAGATNSDYTFTVPLTQTTYFRRKSINTSSEFTYSNTVKLEIVSVNWEDANYVRVHNIVKPNVTDWVAIDNLPIGLEQKFQSTTYYDGLGRPIQKVSRETATPETVGGTWGDMVQFTTYDAFGRSPKSYLPYTTTANIGKYKAGVFTAQASYYTSKYNETNPYSQVTIYDNSPFNTPKTVKSPGTAWANGNGNSVSFAYSNYNDVTNEDPVYYYYFLDNTSSFPMPLFGKAYPAGELFKNTSTDENGKQTIEYIDKSGRLILKKVQLDDNPTSFYEGWICTYNIYDFYGRLRYTIEPEAVKWLADNWFDFVGHPEILEQLCYSYTYDEKGRMIAKRNPGAQELRMMYDLRDRLVYTQDGNQRNKFAGTGFQEFTATLYDYLDRPVLTTLYKTDKSLSTLQTEIDNASNIGLVGTYNTQTQSQTVTDLVVDTRIAGINTYTATNSIEFVPTAANGFTSLVDDEFVAEINPALGPQNATTNTPIHASPITDANLNNASICTILKYVFYDDYTFTGAQPFNNNFNNTQAYPTNGVLVPAIAKTHRTLSFATGSRTRILNTNTFTTATTYYNEDGQPIQILDENIKNGVDITTMQYHYDGRLLSTYNSHTTGGTGYTNFGILTKHVFDKIGRVIETIKTIGNNSPITTASFTYDDIGQLKNKKLAPNYTNTTTGNQGLESLDFSYNIHGQLTGINKDYALKTLGYNKWSNYFGLYLGYDNRDNVFTAPNLNGQITGALWSTQGDNEKRKYDYTYDNAGRLSTASFTQFEAATSTWQNNLLDFTVKGSGSSNKIEYDLNGNILNMLQRGIIVGNNSPIILDDLQYTYHTLSNQLRKVVDAGTAGTANGKQGDFKDGSNGTTDDYAYDFNGNLNKDLNKEIGTNAIKYNYLDKPEEVTIAGKGVVKYVYDASGTKLQKIFTATGSSTSKITTYINQFTYEETKVVSTPALIGGGGELQQIAFEDGRIRVIQATAQNNGLDAVVIDGNINLPNNKRGVFDYFVKDNLTNVRMVLTQQVHQSMSTCTMESNRSSTEQAVFGEQGSNNQVVQTGVDVNQIPGQTSGNGWQNSNIGNRVSKLTKLTNNIVGPNSLLKVMAGDELTTSTQYFYKNTVTNTNTTGLVSSVVNSLIGAISTTSSGSVMLHGGQASNVGTQLNNTTPFVNFTAHDANSSLGNNPKAYLTVLFFDERFNFVPEGSTYIRVTNANSSNEVLALANIKAPKNGYVYIYVSNESDEPVYFDNFKVLHTRGRIIEENHYYAFGLKIAGLSSKKLPDVLEGSLKNEKGYQGEYSNFDDDISWNDFKLRTYDPQIGRWLQQDPYDEFSSPYLGMGNDPVNEVDEDGGSIINFGTITTWGRIGVSAAGAAIGFGIDKASGGKGILGAAIGAAVGLGATFIPPFEIAASSMASAGINAGHQIAKSLVEKYKRRFKEKIGNRIEKMNTSGESPQNIKAEARRLSMKHQNKKWFRYFGAGNHNRRKTYRSKLTGWKEEETIIFNPYVEVKINIDTDAKKDGTSSGAQNDVEVDIGHDVDGEIDLQVTLTPFPIADQVEIFGRKKDGKREDIYSSGFRSSENNPGNDGKGTIIDKLKVKLGNPVRLKYKVTTNNPSEDGNDQWILKIKIRYTKFSTSASKETLKSTQTGNGTSPND